MAKEYKPSKTRKIIVITAGAILIILVLVLLIAILRRSNKENKNDEKASFTQIEEIEQEKKETSLNKLYNMSEQDRITYYCAEFFRFVSQKRYSDAYDLLYDEYKDNYFPTEKSFETYMQTYFPSDFSLEYTNFERLGDIYILWVNVNDTLNGKLGHNFSMYVVIKENDFDDFDLSFSRNSAVTGNTEETEE